MTHPRLTGGPNGHTAGFCLAHDTHSWHPGTSLMRALKHGFLTFLSLCLLTCDLNIKEYFSPTKSCLVKQFVYLIEGI